MPDSSTELTLLLGTGNIGPGPPSTTPHTHDSAEKVKEFLDCWYDLGGKRLDTARLYGVCKEFGPGGTERMLKEYGAEKKFILDTKILKGDAGSLAPEEIRKSFTDSLADLNVDKVNVLYIHGPDRATPLDVILKEFDDIYKQDKFAELGVSNLSAEEVDTLCELANMNGWVKPSVYQGNYSAICRSADENLFPTLRKHGMSFYAYSPLSMGMLIGGPQKESLEAARTLPAGSRFHPDSRKASVFQSIWFRPHIFDAIKYLNKISAESGISQTDLSLRWIAHHSALDPAKGDGLVLGASTVKQLKETTEVIRRGPLGPKEVEGMNHLWDICKDQAPTYCS